MSRKLDASDESRFFVWRVSDDEVDGICESTVVLLVCVCVAVLLACSVLIKDSQLPNLFLFTLFY